MVVTGSGQLSLLDKLNHYFPGIFQRELMVTAFDVKYGKPNPEPYLMALQKAGIQANEAVVIENAPLGGQSGSSCRNLHHRIEHRSASRQRTSARRCQHLVSVHACV